MGLSHRLPPAAPAGDPYYLYAPPPPHPDPQRQGVLTIFVAGLPDDVRSREIHNLFSHRPGFDHCLLEYTGRGNQAVALVSFFTHQAALLAMAALNGTNFELETGDRLHIELAKSTSRRPHGGGDVYRVIDKRVNKKRKVMLIMRPWVIMVVMKHGGRKRMAVMKDLMSHQAPKMKIPAIRMNYLRISGRSALHITHSWRWFHFGQPEHKQQKGQSTSNDEPDKSSGDIPPCSALFIANLGHACTEEELTEVLSKQPGFHVLKMCRRGGMPVAFANFMAHAECCFC